MFQFPRSTALVGVCLLVGSRNLFAQTYGVAVTPQGTTISSKTAHTTGYTYQFRVQNEGTTQQTWNLTCVGASNITCTNWPANVTLAAGAFQMITVTFSTANEGTGQLYLTASNAQSNDQGWVNVPVVLAAGAPRMSVLPYLEAKQDYARCAAACFAATYGQSTVPYFSLDQPRNVTLVYHGDRVDPKPFVAVDVFPDTTFGTWPSEYQFQVKVNGAFVTFANGETLLRFAGTTGSTRYRIGGQFTPSGLIHGKVYPMEILVTSKIGAAFYTNRWITQYLHLDEANSAIGRGWTLAGVQRAHIVADTGILINEGGGSATYFKYNPITAKYEAPSGEFSILSASGSTWVRAYPDSTKVVFNSAGLMVRVADRWGVRDTLIYDGSNRLTQLRDPVNNTITLGYGANGLSSIQDPFGRTTAITVQANKTLTAIQDPDLVSTTFGYDGSLRLLRITDRAGQTDTLAYDSQSGKLSSLKAPQIRVYGGSLTNPVTSFSAWQKVGIPYVATAGTAYGPARADTVYGRVTEPGGTQTTRFTVNRWGSPAVTTNPLSEVTTVTYTVQGQPAKVVAPGYGTAFDTLAYNGSGLLTFQRTVKDSGTTIVYGAAAQPVHIYGPLQDSTHAYLSGTAGKLDSVKVGGQVVQRITSYDAYGRPVTVKDGVNTIIATYAYFTSGTHRNLNSVTLPGSRVTTYAYDTYGRSVTATPPSGTLAQHTRYDALNRVLADSIPTPGTPTVTRYQYDNMHRVTQVTDPKSQVYQYAYNAVGWLARSLDPVNGKDTLQYDPNGDLRRHTNRRAQNIDFTYDALHRPLSRTGSASVSWSYTSNGYTVTATSTASTETTYLGIRGVTDSIKTVLNGQTYWRRYQYTNGTALLDTVTVTGPGGVTFRGRKYLYNVPKGILTTIRLGGGPRPSTWTRISTPPG